MKILHFWVTSLGKIAFFLYRCFSHNYEYSRNLELLICPFICMFHSFHSDQQRFRRRCPFSSLPGHRCDLAMHRRGCRQATLRWGRQWQTQNGQSKNLTSFQTQIKDLQVMECHAKLIEEKGEKGASIEMLRLHTNFKSMPAAAAAKTATSEVVF